MKRTTNEIINELNSVQNLCDRLIMEIGLGYARIRLTNDNSIVSSINQKIEAFKNAEMQLNILEQELSNVS